MSSIDTANVSSSSSSFDGLARAATAAAVAICATALSSAGAAARAASLPSAADAAEWKPRRHHRHIGERFTDAWADAVVEVQEADKAVIRDLERRLQQETRRADDEAARARDAEQRARAAVMQQASRRGLDDDALLSVRLLGADVTGPLTFALLAAAGWQAYSTDLYGRLTGRRRARGGGGRWVYDRSLGGKRVWVPDAATEGGVGGEGGGALPPAMSDADFDALASVAASKTGGAGASASSSSAAAAASAAEWEPPEWWDRPGVLPVSGEAERAARTAEAERVLRRVEAAKNRGEDYELADILALRSACMSAGGASLDTRTVGARDAIFRAAVDAGIRACLDPGSVDLGGYSPLRLAAGVAGDVSLPERRAVTALQGAVAGACRGRIVDAIAAAEKSDDSGALLALAQLGALLDGMPVLTRDSPEVALVAGELNSWASVAARERLLLLVLQIDEAHADLAARLMDLRPEDAIPRARAALRGGGSPGAGGGVGSDDSFESS